ncbi:MAG: proprotein convertase P-domain-containing protein [Phycisphaeraceae bacterium]|nr:proprotein convertase P-domain-containing protein [Phycisphaeraceae bacterium]
MHATSAYSARWLAALAGLAAPCLAEAQVYEAAPWNFAGEFASSGPKANVRKPLALPGVRVPRVSLGPVDTWKLLLEDRMAAARGERVLRYGVGRDCDVRPEDGMWLDVPRDGARAWVVDIVCPTAEGIRVRLGEMNLPPGSWVAVYPADMPAAFSAGPFEGQGPFNTGEVWTPTSAGERVRVEFRCRGEACPSSLPFRITRVQHVYRDPTRGFLDQPCYRDVTCSPSWAAVAKACAGIGFVGQNAMFCSGQMLNTQAGDHTPYLLTAAQCINTASIAQTAEVYFDNKTGQCDGIAPSLGLLPRAVGCSLLSASTAHDSTLLMIEGSLPPNRAWAGWTTALVPFGQAAGSVHFPENQPARLSLGFRVPGAVCGGPEYLGVDWTSGPTGPGSAGGGLFLDNASKSLVGVLSCGSSACGSPGSNGFGSLAAFYPLVSGLLQAGTDDGFEPNDSCRSPAAVVPGTWTGLIVKDVSEDWYTAEVPPGGTFAANLSFVHAHGDIDVELFTDCEQVAVAASTGTTNVESVQWTNTSSTPIGVTLRVYLDSDVRNTYAMTITIGTPPGQGACCLASGACTVTGPASCAAAGGVYAGDGRSCQGTCYTASYVGPLVPIADGTLTCGPAAVATVSINENVRIAAVGAGFRILHPYQGDLRATLRHVPTGIDVTMVDRPGVPQTPFGFPNDNYGASVTNLFVSLDDAPTVYDLPVVGMDNVAGPWKSEGVLNTFAGMAAQGNWQLRVEDCAAGETGSIAAFTLIVAAAPTCYANCDGSTGQPALTANDFACFINLYAAGSSRANCDGSTGTPVLTANDFQCFLNKYAQGCS